MRKLFLWFFLVAVAIVLWVGLSLVQISLFEAVYEKAIQGPAELVFVPEIGDMEPEWAYLDVSLTAYSNHPKCVQKKWLDGRTATNTVATERRTVAVDPSVISLGSSIYISCPAKPEIDGFYQAEDTGRLIKGQIIDLFFDSYITAVDFGRQRGRVLILRGDGDEG